MTYFEYKYQRENLDRMQVLYNFMSRMKVSFLLIPI